MNLERFNHKDVNSSDFAEKFNLVKEPFIFGERESENYANKINPELVPEKHSNICIRKAAEMIPNDLRGKRAIDIGCGEGLWGRFLAKRGAMVLELDNSEQMLKITAERNKNFTNLELIKMDIKDLRNIERKFDIGISSYVLNYFSILKKIMEDLGYIIKKDGEIIIITKTLEFVDNDLKEKFKGFLLPVKTKGGSVIYAATNSFIDYKNSAKYGDFEIIDHYYQKSKDNFKNENLNNLNIIIEDHVLKYKKAIPLKLSIV